MKFSIVHRYNVKPAKTPQVSQVKNEPASLKIRSVSQNKLKLATNCVDRRMVKLLQNQHQKQLLQRQRSVKNFLENKANRPLLPAYQQYKQITVQQFYDTSMFKFIISEVREASLISLMGMSGDKTVAFVCKKLRIKVIPAFTLRLIYEILQSKDKDWLKLFTDVFQRVVCRYYKWIDPKAVRKVESIWDYIRGVSDYNQLRRKFSFKLVPMLTY